MELLLPAFALLAIVGALSVAAWPAARDASRAGRRALALGTLLAAPLAWLGAFGLVEQLLGLAEPIAPAGYASLVLLVLLGFFALGALASRLPPARVPLAAAAVPALAVLLASLKPATTAGGWVAGLLSVALMLAALVLPRALALGREDPSRRFVGIVAALALVMGAGFGSVLGASAVAEGGLGLASMERALVVVVAPDAANATVRVHVPFPAADGAQAPLVEAWRAAARVVDGAGSVSPSSDGGLDVVATGPVRVEARYVFHAVGAEARGVAAYRLDGAGVVADGDARVTWRADAGGCAAREAAVQVRAGETAPLPGQPGPLWPGARC